MLVLQDDVVLAMQLSTSVDPPISKIVDLKHAIAHLVNHAKTLKNRSKVFVRGWVVSLFPFKPSPPSEENIIITEGESLVPVLGLNLYKRLVEAKRELGSTTRVE